MYIVASFRYKGGQHLLTINEAKQCQVLQAYMPKMGHRSYMSWLISPRMGYRNYMSCACFPWLEL